MRSLAEICSKCPALRQALWTEPKDQSGWLYHRWLLGSCLAAAGVATGGGHTRSSGDSPDDAGSARGNATRSPEGAGVSRASDDGASPAALGALRSRLQAEAAMCQKLHEVTACTCPAFKMSLTHIKASTVVAASGKVQRYPALQPNNVPVCIHTCAAVFILAAFCSATRCCTTIGDACFGANCTLGRFLHHVILCAQVAQDAKVANEAKEASKWPLLTLARVHEAQAALHCQGATPSADSGAEQQRPSTAAAAAGPGSSTAGDSSCSNTSSTEPGAAASSCGPLTPEAFAEISVGQLYEQLAMLDPMRACYYRDAAAGQAHVVLRAVNG
jgi:hypothetical protein